MEKSQLSRRGFIGKAGKAGVAMGLAGLLGWDQVRGHVPGMPVIPGMPWPLLPEKTRIPCPDGEGLTSWIISPRVMGEAATRLPTTI